jgi:hypothetical protein
LQKVFSPYLITFLYLFLFLSGVCRSSFQKSHGKPNQVLVYLKSTTAVYRYLQEAKGNSALYLENGNSKSFFFFFQTEVFYCGEPVKNATSQIDPSIRQEWHISVVPQ